MCVCARVDTHLVTEVPDVEDVLLRHLGSHGDLRGELHLRLHLLWQQVRQVCSRYVGTVA